MMMVVVVSLNFRIFGINLGIVLKLVVEIVYDLLRSMGICGLYKGLGVILVR